MEANYWVIATGSDCDGYNNGHIAGFTFEKDAIQYADEQNEWSDGLRYHVTSSLDILRDYCNDYMRDWRNYLNV